MVWKESVPIIVRIGKETVNVCIYHVTDTPFSCSKIIDNPPSATQNHGCPFIHFSPSNLEARLLRDNIGRTHVDQILQLSRDRHYQVACTKHFEVTHPQDKTMRDPIEHPNQYYEASKSLDEELVEKTEQMDESM